MIRVGVFGVTGYAGYELARWFGRHPQAELVWAVSESHAGKQLADVVSGPLDMPLYSADAVDWVAVDVVFTALPHGVAAATVQQAISHNVRVVDLSADLRLETPASYAHWYNNEHPHPELLPAPYGLPEVNRTALQQAHVIANPGCYPTSVVLGLAPLLQAQAHIADEPIIIDAASGVSGAGRGTKPQFQFGEVNENYSAYAVGRVHRHVGEMEQELGKLASRHGPIIFSPHLLPVQRGILSTIYVRVQRDFDLHAIRGLYEQFYRDEPFVRVLPDGVLAQLAHVIHTNHCAVSLVQPLPGTLIIIAAIDNLVKGAAGQAIQNMNLMFGLDETTGLL